MDRRFLIGNYDEDFVEESGKDTAGRGHNEQWFVDVLSLARSGYISQIIGIEADQFKKHRDFVIEMMEKDIEKPEIVKEFFDMERRKLIEMVDENKLISSVKHKINEIVLEEVCHAYGNYVHKISYVVESKNKEEEEYIFNLLNSFEDISEFFNIEKYKYIGNKEVTAKFEIIGKTFEALPETVDRRNKIVKGIFDNLKDKVRILSGVRYVYHVDMEAKTKGPDTLLSELAEL